MNIKIVFLCLFVMVIVLSSCEYEMYKKYEIGIFEVINFMKKDIFYYKNYVSQIYVYQYIEFWALEKGYFQKILVDEGQYV